MDLRPYLNSPEKLARGVQLIRDNLLIYQPFILADDIEVGEGRNFCAGYEGVQTVFDYNVYAKGADVGTRKQPEDPAYFRKCNAEYRAIYDYMADQMVKEIGDISKASFAEIGCNTGLTLFNLAKRGAGKCTGYDWNEMTPVFDWLNDILDTQVAFRQDVYDNVEHRFKKQDVAEHDYMINTVFTNHQCDPIQFLCYVCDRARKGVFLWVRVDETSDQLSVSYDSNIEGILFNNAPFPLCFNNEVKISEKLLQVTLNRLGFEYEKPMVFPVEEKSWDLFRNGYRMVMAKRVRDVKSAYWLRMQETLESQLQQRTRRTRQLLERVKRKLAA